MVQSLSQCFNAHQLCPSESHGTGPDLSEWNESGVITAIMKIILKLTFTCDLTETSALFTRQKHITTYFCKSFHMVSHQQLCLYEIHVMLSNMKISL